MVPPASSDEDEVRRVLDQRAEAPLVQLDQSGRAARPEGPQEQDGQQDAEGDHEQRGGAGARLALGGQRAVAAVHRAGHGGRAAAGVAGRQEGDLGVGGHAGLQPAGLALHEAGVAGEDGLGGEALGGRGRRACTGGIALELYDALAEQHHHGDGQEGDEPPRQPGVATAHDAPGAEGADPVQAPSGHVRGGVGHAPGVVPEGGRPECRRPGKDKWTSRRQSVRRYTRSSYSASIRVAEKAGISVRIDRLTRRSHARGSSPSRS